MDPEIQSKRRNRGEAPLMVWADPSGNIFEAPGWRAGGRRGNEVVPLDPADLIELPPGSEFFLLPGRVPLGFPSGGASRVFEGPTRGGPRPTAVAVFLPPAYTQFALPAFRMGSKAPVLPLYAYTAVAFVEGKFMVPAVRVDDDIRQEPAGFDCGLIEAGIKRLIGASPGNRLLVHLSRCATEYFCPAARNLFLGRWEAPLPSSPSCNARCIGCISLQPSGCCPATQARIDFVPTPDELVEVATGHFGRVPDGVASFGQGCEGEPLLVAGTLASAVEGIRRATPDGTVNLNTNGSLPGEVERLAAAGLDSIRVSLNSARREVYEAYHRPVGYRFDDVVEGVRRASRAGLHVSLNYFVFPGVTDQPDEMEALERLIEEAGVDMIQWRNLNIDPDLYLAGIPALPGSPGIPAAMARVRERFPDLRHGYFNPPLNRRPTAGGTSPSSVPRGAPSR
jgi:pyruvate-formate lyase-activating enzyme